MSELEGILAVYKPAGFTSHDVVAKVRRILKMKRIGHTGTLDPQVTGVLPLCLGRATRVVEYMQELPKEYIATMRLGLATDTEDLTGRIIEQVDSVSISKEEVEKVLITFQGTISQVPPMYSAVKVDGKRLYELAREGKTVERKSREVTIYEIVMTNSSWDGIHPELTFRALCSKGTYIRTLCVDIGRALGLPSVMVKLERTKSAGINAEHCLSFDDIQRYMDEGTLHSHLIPVDQAIPHLSAHTVSEDKTNAAIQGQRLSYKSVSPEVTGDEPIRLYDHEHRFLGIFQRQQETGAIAPIKVFL
ncbi:tRNA pseudouridine(55) synthase TruB [Paenibacillus crassostreae]|uniref:tRNA pseudouridine synthase B n=1 Tax=Paenibacillus crassostreae TaxID=1763538 RepID=A0A167FM10_9BACL|nr:tRNA pseudouridine(55) synthase TruB [Paenibacillus crassostreae]AOZ94267.1 tRNA pseudouridine(55) synthase TruB [Paenibacillus crassostreae]OAB76697.1 pseudouridine synthase [Paenibacillus crassostreae]